MLVFMRHAIKAMIFAVYTFVGISQAADITLSTLTPSTDASHILTLHGPEGRNSISRLDIEQSRLYELSLQHFEGLQGRFAGVWLEDFLNAQGIGQVETLRFIAHDDYTIFLTSEDRLRKRYFLATRFDDKPLTRKEFGPTMLLIPEDSEAVRAGTESMTTWIWSIKDIYLQP
ncbi:hypothetical protein HaloA020_18020 [Halomonas sp. A020]|nr:hypothetical protein HaloA020_18020 [Halomonas sp. A020]